MHVKEILRRLLHNVQINSSKLVTAGEPVHHLGAMQWQIQLRLRMPLNLATSTSGISFVPVIIDATKCLAK